MADGKGFTHLHLHSQYSLLDGAITFEKLFERCKELGMDPWPSPTTAICSGRSSSTQRRKAAQIKPIIGIEAYIAPGSRFDRTKTCISDAAYHLILLAENNTGYQNLLKLASIGYIEGFYYRPRIDKEILAEFNEGLICTSACLKGEVAVQLAGGDKKAAKAVAESYLKIFGPEQVLHRDPEPRRRRPERLPGADRPGEQDGRRPCRDKRCALSQRRRPRGPQLPLCDQHGQKRRRPGPDDLSAGCVSQERRPRCGSFSRRWPQACDNTLAIAERCNVELDLKHRHAPRFSPPTARRRRISDEACVMKGRRNRTAKSTTKIKERLDRELDVIESKGFASYFLIVWDFCNYAHQNNIPVGARGSGVGTLVGYCLGLCDVDPIRYDLLFERFMDPQRNEMPDIDIDICQVAPAGGHRLCPAEVRPRRPDHHLRDDEGQGRHPRHLPGARRAAGRGGPAGQARAGSRSTMTLDKALETEPELKQAYENDRRPER